MIGSNASLAFINLSAANKTTMAANVLECLTNNPELFPDLPVKLSALTQTNANLVTAVANVQTGSKVSRSALKNALKAWNTDFRATAKYVSAVAEGDEQTINTAGFTATKNYRQSVPEPGFCKGFETNLLKGQGSFNAGSQAISQSRGYFFVAAPDGVTIEQQGNQLSITVGGITSYIVLCTRSKTQFNNVPSGKLMYLSMLAFNASGAGPLTNGQQVIPQ